MDFLVFAFVVLGVSNTAGSGVSSGAGSGAGSGVGISSRFFIVNIFL